MENIQNTTLIATEIILAVVVFKLVLSNWHPPIQESKQALLCILGGIIISMIIEPNIHSFVLGVIASGIGFYGGIYFKELREIKDGKNDLEG